MAFANSGDPTINPKEGGDFDKFPKGVYTLVGIKDYFSKDDNDLPVFKPIQNAVKAHCHFEIAEQVAGDPAWSGTAEDYVRLAEALGADLEGLKVRSDTEFLLEIQKRIDNCEGSSKMYVGENGWVRMINVMRPTTGTYRIKFVRAFSLDNSEIISFQERETSFGSRSVVRFMFEIVSDIDDDVTYAGETFTVEVEDPFDGVMNGLPAWRHAKNGGMLVGQRRLLTFLQIFWPDVEDYKWVVDPEESHYGINEAANPIHVIAAEAAESNKQAILRIEMTEKGFVKADLRDLSPTRSATPTTAKPIKDVSGQKVRHLELTAVINKLAGYPVFDPTDSNPYQLTKEGIVWCKERVAPVWDELKLGTKRVFGNLTQDQAKQLIAALQLEYGQEETDEVEEEEGF